MDRMFKRCGVVIVSSSITLTSLDRQLSGSNDVKFLGRLHNFVLLTSSYKVHQNTKLIGSVYDNRLTLSLCNISRAPRNAHYVLHVQRLEMSEYIG